MKDYMKKECGIVFLVGAVAGIIIPKLAKSQKTRELAVKGVAQSFVIKDSVKEKIINIKEEADDIYNEAKNSVQEEATEEENQ